MKNLFIALSVFTLLSLISCDSEKNESHSHHSDIEFLVTSPIIKDTSLIKEYVCQIKSIRHIEIRALEKGYLQSIFVDEGQLLKKGQKMFQILPSVYSAERQKALAELKFTEIEYKNTKLLADSNIVSQNELALAEAKYNQAKAILELSQVHLGFTQITAPFDGIMDRFHVREGSLIDEGELLTTLSDNSEMWVYFNVPESEYLDYMSNNNLNDNTPVKLKMANHKIFDQTGYIKTIEADFNSENGNIAFRANFPNPNRLLRHGETGNILITQPIKNALIIPQKSTYEILDKKYVFVVDKNNVVKAKQIKISAELPHLFVVSSGLSKDDKIILEGLRKVKANSKIKYKFLKPESVMSNLNLYAE